MKINTFPGIFCAALLLAVLGPLYGGPNVWTSNGPFGGHIVALAIHPGSPNVIYAGCDDSGGLFKSTDGGETWAFVSSSVPDVCGWAIAIDPQEPNVVYASDIYGFGIFKSTDDGNNWQFINTGLGETHVTCIAVRRDSISIVYAGTGGWRFPGNGIYKSTNAGASWVSSGLSGMKVYCLAMHSDLIFCGTHGNGLYRSTDAGNSWSPVSLAIPYVNCLAFKPFSEDTVYAGTLSGIYRTTDAGNTWDSLGLFNRIIWSLTVDRNSPNVIYASTLYDGLFKSTDTGQTWFAINAGINQPLAFCVAVDPYSSATLYHGTAAGGVYKSTNAGAYWTQKIQGMKNTYAFGLVPHPDSANIIYCGRCYAEPGQFFFRSTNAGQSWTSLTQYVNVGLTSLIMDPVDHRVFYAGGIKAIVKTTDHGANWMLLDSLLSAEERVPAMAIDQNAANIVYACAYLVIPDTGISVRWSTDYGVNWTEIGFFPKTIQSNALDPVSDILHGGALALNPVSSNIIYAGAFGGVFKTTNAGNTWTVQGLQSEAIFCLEVNPDSVNIIYAGCESGRVYKSTDAGGNWQRIDPGWPPAMIADILVDPSATNDVYVGRDASDWHTGVHGGVSLSTNGGATWTEVDSGLTTTHAVRLAIDTTARTLYCATYGGGVFAYTFSTGIEERDKDAVPRNPVSLRIHPNPFFKQTKISFTLEPGEKNPEIKIYDAAGRLVRIFSLPTTYYILHSALFWDAADDQGEKLPGGIYFAEFAAGNKRTIGKIILCR